MSSILSGFSHADKLFKKMKQMYVTLKQVGEQSVALEVLARLYYQEISSDIVDSFATNSNGSPVITAAGHSAIVGDLIRMTSGNSAKIDYFIQAVTATTIVLDSPISSALVIAGADTFKIMRSIQPSTDADGNLNITPVQQDVKESVDYDHAVPVTTGAWTELIAATGAITKQLEIFDSSGQLLELGTGAAAAEVRKLLITPGGNDDILGVSIPAGTRISVRAVDADTAAGFLAINFIG